MAFATMPTGGLRQEQAQTSRLAWAFVLSIALHLCFYGAYVGGRKLGIWKRLHWPAWMESSKMLTEILKKPAPPKPKEELREIPLMFVDVSPAQATVEVPKKSEYYSDRNSIAANPNPQQDLRMPKIDGKQTEVLRTENVPQAKTLPLQPSVPKPAEAPKEKAKETQEEEKPKSAPAPGDLAMGKPEPDVRKDDGKAVKPRPKTVAEALARTANNRLAGEKIKKDGGARRASLESSLDVIATGFGAYDMAIITAVQNRWYDLLEGRSFVMAQTGKVTVKFRLSSDGSVRQLELSENTVDLALALLCQSAIKDPAPFAPWPSDMKREIGADYRDVTFTFYYY